LYESATYPHVVQNGPASRFSIGNPHVGHFTLDTFFPS
jgi:hypothetical protein